jgi:hypothetical protein
MHNYKKIKKNKTYKGKTEHKKHRFRNSTVCVFSNEIDGENKNLELSSTESMSTVHTKKNLTHSQRNPCLQLNHFDGCSTILLTSNTSLATMYIHIKCGIS